MKRNLVFFLIFILLIASTTPNALAKSTKIHPSMLLPERPVRLDPAVQSQMNALQSGELMTVIVQLRQRAVLAEVKGKNRGERISNVIAALRGNADRSQAPMRLFLQAQKKRGHVSRFESLWVVNGFSVTADAVTIQTLANMPEVYSITPDVIDIIPAYAMPEPGISTIQAPTLWDLGFTGQGVVIASLDSGVDLSHPDLVNRWRGGANSWYDPFGQHPSLPVDMSGHGTATMGVMVGGDAGGTSIGVAPGAQWIAARIFDDSGASTATAIHLGYQWLLDPDHDPLTDDAPQVVNNSWSYATPGCNLEFEPDLQSLRAAGILPVFAAGNSGPADNTSVSPANNPSAFAVGAVNGLNRVYGLSSRGPSDCGGSTDVFPDLVAPGVNINSTDLMGFYNTSSGTSLSAPHVAGGLALLLSAYPNLSVSLQDAALRASATDLGVIGPDNYYGYGLLNLPAAYQWLAAPPTETPTPLAASPTSSPTPTLTSAPTYTSLPSNTPTSAPAFTATNTVTPLPTFTSTNTSTPLPTFTSTPTKTNTPLPTFTSTPTTTSTPTANPTFTNTPATNLLYFSTLGNTNPPGVSGTADDADIYYFNGSTFSRAIDASGTGSLLNIASAANVDGYDRINPNRFYLSFTDVVTLPTVGTIQDEDVVYYNNGIWSLYFDGSA
ncbi:MAG TPA: S8 family serine peptidase, partial [Anaerolineales bacterium]|nr:S8 family serine peptidase [Anaerolineales bacterium]